MDRGPDRGDRRLRQLPLATLQVRPIALRRPPAASTGWDIRRLKTVDAVRPTVDRPQHNRAVQSRPLGAQPPKVKRRKWLYSNTIAEDTVFGSHGWHSPPKRVLLSVAMRATVWARPKVLMTVYVIRHSDSGVLVGDRVELADRPWSRMKGLIGRAELGQGEGLLLSPCQSVHMYGLAFTVDVLFLDEAYRVVAVYEELEPGRRTNTHQEARYAVKLAAGTVARAEVEVGQRLVLDQTDGVESVH